MDNHLPWYIKKDGSDSIVIFIHGFMGSPSQFSSLAGIFAEKGFSAASVLLPGHGTAGLNFAKSTFRDWEEHLQSELDRFSDYKKIFLVGHSIGGLLALNASAGISRIESVTAVASPLKFYYFAGLFRKLKLLFSKNAELKKAYLEAYSINMSFLTYFLLGRVFMQPFLLAKKTKANLKNITVPVLIIHSEKDETVSFKSSEMFEKGLVNASETILRLKDSNHGYAPQADREMIADSITEFICSQNI